MANGQQHARAGRAIIVTSALVPVSAISIALGARAGQDIVLAVSVSSIGFLSGAIMGYLITPDIDHPWYTVEEQRIRRATNAAVLGLWKLFWFPFVIAKHRSRITHSWPLATALKLAWLMFWILVGAAIVLRVLDISVTRSVLRQTLPMIILSVIPFFAGWSVQDLTHLYMDGMLFKKGEKREAN